jgi:hypothetical protein
MKCDGCGQQFPGQEAVQDTRGEFGPNGRQAYRIAPITLCRKCASYRRNILCFLVALIAVPVIACLVVWWLRYLGY